MTMKTIIPLEKAVGRATSQAKSNPDFEKLALYLLFKALDSAVTEGALSCDGAEKVLIRKNPTSQYAACGWYSTDFPRVMAAHCGVAPADLMLIISHEMDKLQSKHGLLKRWQVSSEGELFLWERKDYLMFHLTMMKRRLR